MDFILFAIEHGRPAAFAFALIFSASLAFFCGLGLYDSTRSTPTPTGANLVRANFNLEDLPETESGRKTALVAAYIISIFIFWVSFYTTLFLARYAFNFVYQMFWHINKERLSSESLSSFQLTPTNQFLFIYRKVPIPHIGGQMNSRKFIFAPNLLDIPRGRRYYLRL